MNNVTTRVLFSKSMNMKERVVFPMQPTAYRACNIALAKAAKAVAT